MEKKKNTLQSELRFMKKTKTNALKGFINYNHSGLKKPMAKEELMKAYGIIDRALNNEIDYLENNYEDYLEIYGE